MGVLKQIKNIILIWHFCCMVFIFPVTAAKNGTYECDFEQRVICSFLTNDQNNKENWQLGTGKVSDDDTGPFVDHTLGNELGSYIFVNGAAAKTNYVKLQTIVLTENYCVRFFYHMYGENVGSLITQVFSMSNSAVNTYFIRDRGQGDQWKEASFSVTMDDAMKLKGYKVIFVAKPQNTSQSRGDIALDDIVLKPGKCPDTERKPEAFCNFDDYDCGFYQGGYSGIKWERKSTSSNGTKFGSKPSIDNTLGTRYGGYWFAGSYKSKSAFAHQYTNLKSMTFAAPKQTINCVHFYYNINANFTDWSQWIQDESLKRIYLELELFDWLNKRTILAKIENTTELGQWHFLQARAYITTSFTLVFDATINTNNEVVMAIDDVQMFPGECDQTDPCAKVICKNRGRCYVGNPKPFCRCTPSFTGNSCEIDKCSLITCENNGKCFIEGGKPSCKCTEQYEGEKCEIDKCSLIACGDNGKCVIDYGKAICDCSAKYTGDKCDIDKCSLISCKNNGKCIVEYGRAFCKCTEKYTGENCDVEKCSLITCENDGVCSVQAGKAVCNCSSKYTGDKCDIDKCSFITCQNEGTCIIEVGKPVCKCTAQYTGEKCETDKCSLITCENDGACVIEATKAVCNCTAKYTGEKCNVDKCSLINCQNGGKCEIKMGKPRCSCINDFTGKYCAKLSKNPEIYQAGSKAVPALGSVTGIVLILLLITLFLFYRRLQKEKNDNGGENSLESGILAETCQDSRNDNRNIEMKENLPEMSGPNVTQFVNKTFEE